MSKRIIVVSGKGGTGKSTFAVNTALSLAYRKYRTLLLDMNTGLRTLDLYLGVQDRAIYDIYDVICGRCGMEQALLTSVYSPYLGLIPACQTRDVEISTEQLRSFLDGAASRYDFVILDCPPGIGGRIDACVPCADAAAIVLTSDYAAVRDADATEDYLIRSGIMNRGYIVNRMMPALIQSGIEPDVSVIDTRLKCRMLGMIAEEESIRAATSAGVPVVTIRDSYIAQNFDRITDRLMSAIR
ncbi:MAG: AAA family ATPase [Mogibacterium sp.]|nr:AAA family ATPase [Mogibacterium sp.]